MERECRPDGEQFAEPSGVNPFDAPMQRQQLNLPDIVQYYDMWVSLLSETAGDLPPQATTSLRNVGLGLGFLFYDQWGDMGYIGRAKQVAFQKRLERLDEAYQGQLVLTYEEGLMLRDAAAAVNVAYDPGEPAETPENMQKRTFIFTDLDQKANESDIAGRVVEAEQ